MNSISGPCVELRKERRENLKRFLRPRSIAFVGGAQVSGAIDACRRYGFEGEFYAVNPRRDEINGIPCVDYIEDLPEAPDAALLALSPERTLEAIKQLVKIGAGGAACISNGYAEYSEEGAAIQRELVEVASHLAVLGPNCMGFMNHFDGALVWGTDNHVEEPCETGAAIISQSGAIPFGIANTEQVFPLGYTISTGNQAVLDTADCIEGVLADDRVRAIGLYLEGLEDGNALGDACRHAMEKGVPVIALKGGDTPAGESVAIGHTGAMVVERDLWNAFAERYGIVEVSSPKALVEALKFLTVSGMPKGNRLSVMTVSGGMNGIIAARAPELGLRLEQPTEKSVEKLKAILPDTVPIANPMDFNTPFQSDKVMSLENGDGIADSLVIFCDGVADMLVYFLDVPRPDEKNLDEIWLPGVECLMQVRERLGIPVAMSSYLPEGLDVPLRRRLLAGGVPSMLGFADTLEAFSVAARLATVHAEKTATDAPGALLTNSIPVDGRMLDEGQSKDLLQPCGLKMPARWAGPCAKAAEAAERLGYPLAVKVVSDTIAHKAKIGGVKLNLLSASDVVDAVNEISDNVSSSPEGHAVEQVLLERMIENPVAEYIVGIKRHPALGIALMIGRGGTQVESLRHFATVLLPLEERATVAAMECVGMTPETLGYIAFLEAIKSIAAFATDHQDSLVGMDVNPVVITAAGEAIAADALVVMRED